MNPTSGTCGTGIEECCSGCDINIHFRDEEEVAFARKVVSSLSVLAAHVLSPAEAVEPSEDGLRLLEYLRVGLRAQNIDAETAAVCISAVSGALVNYKVSVNYVWHFRVGPAGLHTEN